MIQVLNSPVEVGLRALFVLAQAYPVALDISSLVLLDHGILNSADLGGPASLHPPLPGRSGELGMKRQLVEDGLQILVRSELAELALDARGIQFRASEEAYGFTTLLQTPYASGLRERAKWIVGLLLPADEASIRNRMRSVLGNWTEEFSALTPLPEDE
jgi:hypothetical protein